MRNLQHKTKTKGDLGVAMVIAAFAQAGIGSALPLSEHYPFDLIAILEGKLLRVSVKYREKDKKTGSVSLALSSVWSDRQGNHVLKTQRGDVDAHALYCPDSKECYFIRDDEISSSKTASFRVDRPKTKVSGARFARSYLDPRRLFDGSLPDVSIVPAEWQTEARKIGTPRRTGLPRPEPALTKEPTAWPDDQALRLEVWKQPVTLLAGRLGVSSSAVRKHCQCRGIPVPGRGYWQKLGATNPSA